MPTRQRVTALLAAALLHPNQGWTQTADLYQLQRALINRTAQEFFAALDAVKIRDKPDRAAGLIAAMRFTNGPAADISKVPATLTEDHSAQTLFDGMLCQEQHPEVVPDPSFIKFKRDVLLAIDPKSKNLLKPRTHPTRRFAYPTGRAHLGRR